MEIRIRVAALALLACVAMTAPLLAVPSAPTSLSATVNGSTVSLTWSAATGGVIVGYRLEAGTAPTLSNLASSVIGASTTFAAANVPPGTYYVRVRAVALDGESAPSNEVMVTVGSSGTTSCATPPNAPVGLTHTISGAVVTLAWSAGGGCAATNYVLLVGSAPGLSNVAIANVGGLTSFSAAAPVGTYYVRVIGQNAFGSSPASNEIFFTIAPASAPTVPPSPSPLEADLVFCVAETNRYRAMLGLPPVARSSALEAYAADGAREDGLAHAAHQHFRAVRGIAFAENEIPWWRSTSIRTVMQQGLAMMWAEGPGGGHYENMRGRYTQLGCGVFVNGPEITIVQDFR